MTKKPKIKFKTEIRKVSDLIDCEYNPRTLSKTQYEDLKKSFLKFGYVEICAINKDNTILAGHQRVHVMKDLGWEEEEIEVRVPNELLNKADFDEYLVRSNKNSGDWDYDLLANNFDVPDLKEWGFTDFELKIEDWESDLEESNDEDLDDSLEETIKIKCPQGLKDSILEIIKPQLKDLDVKIS